MPFLCRVYRQRNRNTRFLSFLKRFSIVKEEMQIDLDEFDLSYYTYGMSIYKKYAID